MYQDEILVDEQDRWVFEKFTITIVIKGKAKNKYAIVWRGGRQVYLHRLIMSAESNDYVDHINGDGLDNRRSNLRICSHVENMQNRQKHALRTSKYRGISLDNGSKNKCKWRAIITHRGKRYDLGRYETELLAIIAWNQHVLSLNDPFLSTQIIY